MYREMDRYTDALEDGMNVSICVYICMYMYIYIHATIYIDVSTENMNGSMFVCMDLLYMVYRCMWMRTCIHQIKHACMRI